MSPHAAHVRLRKRLAAIQRLRALIVPMAVVATASLLKLGERERKEREKNS